MAALCSVSGARGTVARRPRSLSALDRQGRGKLGAGCTWAQVADVAACLAPRMTRCTTNSDDGFEVGRDRLAPIVLVQSNCPDVERRERWPMKR